MHLRTSPGPARHLAQNRPARSNASDAEHTHHSVCREGRRETQSPVFKQQPPTFSLRHAGACQAFQSLCGGESVRVCHEAFNTQCTHSYRLQCCWITISKQCSALQPGVCCIGCDVCCCYCCI